MASRSCIRKKNLKRASPANKRRILTEDEIKIRKTRPVHHHCGPLRRKRSSSTKKRSSRDRRRIYENCIMRKLCSSNEASELSGKEIREILRIVRSQTLPHQTTFTQWNEYQISFYRKMCSSFGVDQQHQEAA